MADFYNYAFVFLAQHTWISRPKSTHLDNCILLYSWGLVISICQWRLTYLKSCFFFFWQHRNSLLMISTMSKRILIYQSLKCTNFLYAQCPFKKVRNIQAVFFAALKWYNPRRAVPCDLSECVAPGVFKRFDLPASWEWWNPSRRGGWAVAILINVSLPSRASAWLLSCAAEPWGATEPH